MMDSSNELSTSGPLVLVQSLQCGLASLSKSAVMMNSSPHLQQIESLPTANLGLI